MTKYSRATGFFLFFYLFLFEGFQTSKCLAQQTQASPSQASPSQGAAAAKSPADTAPPPRRVLNGPFVLVLDAGHGGHDSGAKGRYSMEKDVALSITLKVASLVRINSKDINLILTRSTDDFIELNERARIANQYKSNLFVCIHCNSVRNHRYSPEGAETYVLGLSDVNRNLENAIRENSVITLEANYQEKYGGFDPNSPESYIIFSMKQNRNLRKSLRIANEIQAQFYKNNRVDRGVKQEPLLVLRNTTMPGILVETGYISSAGEEDYLNSGDGQNTLARSIYDALVQYKNEMYK